MAIRIQPRVFLRSDVATLTGVGVVGSSAPVPPPVVTGDRVQLAENHANWTYAHRQLYARWPVLGGTWLDANNIRNGTTPYATATSTTATPKLLQFTVTAAVIKLLSSQYANTGFFIHAIGSGTTPAIWSRNGGSVPPALQVVTSNGTVNPVCIEDTYLHPTANNLGSLNFFHPPALIKFDLSGITGTVTSAVLSLYCFTFYTVPITLAADVIEMPPIYSDPVGQGLTIAQGIASEVATDADLESHPSVIRYDNFESDADVTDDYNLVVASHLGTGGHTYVPWPEHNLTALRVTSSNQSLILRADRWVQPYESTSGPVGSPQASWKRPWAAGQSLGYDELFLRFLIKLPEELNVGMTELGMKLFTLAGRYEWGNYTPGIPQLDQDEMWEYMTWHGPVAVNNPHVYVLAAYCYDQGHSFQDFPSNGDIRVADNFYLRAGRKHCIEMQVRLNTLTGSPLTPNSNGIHRMWLDGALAYEDTTRRIRNLPHVQIQSAPQMQIYHGGLGKPAAPFAYEVTGVCIASSYIGPPVNNSVEFNTTPPTLTPQRDVNGAISNYSSLPLYRWCQVADTKLIDLLPTLPPECNASKLSNVINSWGGGAYDPATGDVHCHGAAHGGGGEEPGTYTINVRKGRWRTLISPIYMTDADKAYLDFIQKYWYVMWRPTQWEPNKTYTQTEFIWAPGLPVSYRANRVYPTVKNGFIYQKQTSSATPQTSGSTEPTWPTVLGQTVVDNQITWVCTVNNNPFSGNWNSGMPPNYATLPVPGSTSLSPEPTHDAPNATDSGKQYAFHCWDKWRFIPWMGDNGKIFMCLMKLQFLDPVTGVLTFGQNYNDTNDQTVVVDPVTERLYGFTMESSSASTRFRQYNPVTDTFEVNHDMNLSPTTQYNLSSYPGWCIRGREIFFIKRTSPQAFFAFHMDNKSWRAITMSSNIIYRTGKNTEFRCEYIPPLDLIVGVFPDGYMFSANPITGEIIQPANFIVGDLTVPADATANGAYGKLNYLEDLGILTFVCSASQNLMVMRME